jgi:hypothetical protein
MCQHPEPLIAPELARPLLRVGLERGLGVVDARVAFVRAKASLAEVAGGSGVRHGWAAR